MYRTLRRMKPTTDTLPILMNESNANNYNKCYSSRHPGGAQFGFGDGSVHFLAETMSPEVYGILGMRSSRKAKSF